MTLSHPGEPLTYPVAGLLGELPGAIRVYPVAGVTIDIGPDLELADPIEGRVRLTRTNRGLIADAKLHTAIVGVCSRCLRDIEIPLDLAIDEEVLPSVDLTTRAPIDVSAEPEAERLNGHHELELEPLVREAIQLAEPIAPLCREDCPGLCAVCGEELAPHPHQHDEEIDPRMEALLGFTVDGDARTD
ncbi:MAG TPA: DUF177 domain-containing protein [Candidatus Saccharimonadales bacterium]|nr:DUF177 domain-containing protein [Candidatus Saccharimonadales bacterium]